MGQMSWRAPSDLLDRVRAAASRQGKSMNDYVTAVLAAATDPSLAGSEAERVRERLAAAGLLVPVAGQRRRRQPASAVAAARKAAGRGTALRDLVSEDRG